MNILSIISFTVFILFVLLGFYSLKLNKNNTLNQFAFFECIILSVQAFTYTFFYIAPTPEDAMFWHKIGCFGGSLFPPFAVYFFLILTKRNRNFKHFQQHLLFYIFPLIIFAKNIFSPATCFASDFVQSTASLGWTYVNSASNLWTWIHVLYLGIYFGVGFYLLFQWKKESQYKTQKRQALAIILVDTVVLILGLTTDIILPLFTHYFRQWLISARFYLLLLFLSWSVNISYFPFQRLLRLILFWTRLWIRSSWLMNIIKFSNKTGPPSRF